MTARTASAKAMSVAVGIAQPLGAVEPGDGEVDDRRDDHPADRCRDRDHGALRVPQVTGDELALEFQPGDEEEDGQQPVARPGFDREVEMQGGRADLGVEQLEVAVRPGRVRPDQRDHRADEQQRAADRLLAQHRRDPAVLCPGSRGEQRLHLRGHGLVLPLMAFGVVSDALPTRLPGAPRGRLTERWAGHRRSVRRGAPDDDPVADRQRVEEDLRGVIGQVDAAV